MTALTNQAARLERRLAALSLRPSMSPRVPAPNRLRIATWNVNSLRARLPAIERFLQRANPDIICLQETKAPRLSEAAMEMFDRRGYAATHVGAGGYNGVAVAARHPVREIVSSGAFNDPYLDREPRVATCVVATPGPVRVVSVYVPHGRALDHWHYDFKLSFLDSLAERIRGWLRDDGSVLLAGDINVAATNSDVFHPAAFVGSTHVSAPERAALTQLFEAGLVDVDVARWGSRARRFTWWNYGIGYARNLGMRLDIVAADVKLAARLDTTWVDHAERETNPASDHAALVADFHLDGH